MLIADCAQTSTPGLHSPNEFLRANFAQERCACVLPVQEEAGVLTGMIDSIEYAIGEDRLDPDGDIWVSRAQHMETCVCSSSWQTQMQRFAFFRERGRNPAFFQC